ncbi:MAG: methionyl-tRNA formyltransferase, partial [Patescibacteria group bacterium]
MTSPKLSKFAFFGTDEFAVAVLRELTQQGVRPDLIVTTPDAHQGRGLVLTPAPVKLWAEENKIPYSQPVDLKAEGSKLQATSYQLFLLASYGKIIPAEILKIPEFGILNIHPSLLPKYRGATPIQSALLAGEAETGVTLMLMDEQVDHGPILGAASCHLLALSFLELRDKLAQLGAKLFLDKAPDYLAGKLRPEPQDESQATFTKKIKKEAGLIKLDDDPELNYRKFLAYHPWPGIYYFTPSGKRVKVTLATLEDGQFVIKRIIPEGKREMPYEVRA